MGSLFQRLTSARMGKTHHAYFRLPRLSDRLAFGTSADGDHCGRHGVCSSCSTRWNAITPRRRGRGFTEYLGLASALLASRTHFLTARQSSSASRLARRTRAAGSGGARAWPMIAPFAELVRLSRTSIVDEMREDHRRRECWGQARLTRHNAGPGSVRCADGSMTNKKATTPDRPIPLRQPRSKS
jgi:hypothetical protein